MTWPTPPNPPLQDHRDLLAASNWLATPAYLDALSRAVADLVHYASALSECHAALCGSGEELRTADNIEQYILCTLQPLLTRLKARRDFVARALSSKLDPTTRRRLKL